MANGNKITYGTWTFVDDEIKSGRIGYTISLMSSVLEPNTFSAIIETDDESIVDFERNAPLVYYYKNEKKGIFYVQDIKRTSSTLYKISATSAIGLLIEGLHYGGIYTGQTVAEVLPSICGTVPYVIKTNLQDIALYGWLPIATPRDNLSQVLFAIGASIKTDLDGVLHIENLWNGISGTFGKDRMYQGPSVDYTSKVTQVVVTEHQYVEGGDETDLFEGTAQDGDIITFDEPMYNLQATGFAILESNANYAKVSAGSGTLKGNAYIHNTRQVAQDVLTANEPNIKTVTEATLVSLVNSRAVAERVANYYKCVETINANAVYQGENPGDLLSTWHPYDLEAVSACLQNADVSMSNTLKADEGLLVGFAPIKEEQSVIYDQKEILTGSGTWVPPEGTVSAHVVLIGGGGKGEDGESGSSSISHFNSVAKSQTINFRYISVGETEPVNVSANANGTSGQVGTGGEGGAAGVQGYVYETDIDISNGQTFSYSCGTPGTTSGETGGATTFGEYSSADGGVLPNGYIDITTGIAYAVPGKSGIKGGDGGSGGDRGEDVASATGGYGVASESDGDSMNVNIEDSKSRYTITGTTSCSISRSASGGGGAGGGTSDNPGENGGNASSHGFPPECTTGGTVMAYVGYTRGGDGGKGANGKNGETFGSPGDGGSGGGGAGQSGSKTANGSIQLTARKLDLCDDSQSFTVYAGMSSDSGDWANGGDGGTGGQGKEGCIIVYYGVVHKVESGPVVTSENKYFLDKNRRRLVV